MPHPTEEVAMAAEKLPLRKTREILRLKLQSKLSQRAIARSVKVASVQQRVADITRGGRYSSSGWSRSRARMAVRKGFASSRC